MRYGRIGNERQKRKEKITKEKERKVGKREKDVPVDVE